MRFFWVFFVLLSCMPSRLDLGSSKEAEIRQHLLDNRAAVTQLQIEWNGLLESTRLGLLPFRLEAFWQDDSSNLHIKTPFGASLLSLSSGEGEARLKSGSALRPLLEGLLKEAPALERLALMATLELLEGRGLRVGKDKISSEVMKLLLNDLPEPLRDALLGDPEAMFSLLSGLYVPGEDAQWYSHQKAFLLDGDRWELGGRYSFPQLVQRGFVEIQLSDYRRNRGVFLPARICMLEPQAPRRLTLERRRVKVRRK